VTTRWEVERAVFTSDLTPHERLTALTLLAMTDQGNAVIPAEYTPSLSRIQAMTGQSPATVKRALNVLEAAGWVMRRRPDVAKARAGKERTRYALKIPKARLTQSLARLTQSLGLGSERATGLGSHRATSHTPFHTENKQQSDSSPETVVCEATGATPEEATAIVKRIHAERNPKNLAGFVRHLAAAGDLAQYLTDQRAAAVRAADDADRKIRQSMPRCEHGTAGGDQPHSATGQIRCGSCRNRGRADRLNGTARVINLHTKEVS
jgi:DNA-binding transcriptional regulator YhcF (GntR family)